MAQTFLFSVVLPLLVIRLPRMEYEWPELPAQYRNLVPHLEPHLWSDLPVDFVCSISSTNQPINQPESKIKTETCALCKLTFFGPLAISQHKRHWWAVAQEHYSCNRGFYLC
jgi:hypothetical protein